MILSERQISTLVTSKGLEMHCPKCQNIYQDPSLKFCLQDGTPLESDHRASPQEAPTIIMQAAETEAERIARVRFERVYSVVMHTVIRLLGEEVMSFEDIMSCAPRFLTEEQVKTAIADLIKQGSLRRTPFGGRDVYTQKIVGTEDK